MKLEEAQKVMEIARTGNLTKLNNALIEMVDSYIENETEEDRKRCAEAHKDDIYNDFKRLNDGV